MLFVRLPTVWHYLDSSAYAAQGRNMRNLIKSFAKMLVDRQLASDRKRQLTGKQNAVTRIENDGGFIDAQFLRENGEMVIGIYKRVGWHSAPKIDRDKIDARTESLRILPMADRTVATDERNIVTAIKNDGDDITAQFVRENGEVVVGIYEQVGWALAPKAYEDDILERIKYPPLTIVYTQRRCPARLDR